MEVLYESENNQTYLVTHIPTVPLLGSLGIYEGSLIVKETTYGLGGPVLVSVDAREVAIGKKIAVQIKVEKVEEI